jgi:purine-binding chemotaxis protein CheW
MSESSGEGLRRAFQKVAADREQQAEVRAEQGLQILSFTLSDEWYGFRLTSLVEIIGGVDPTPIPFTPAFIPGVINHRGSIVSVVDMKKVFGLATRYRREKGRVILVGSKGAVVGFQVDAISDVIDVTESQIEPPLSTIEKVKADYMEGCVRLPRGLLVLLDAEALIHELKAVPAER